MKLVSCWGLSASDGFSHWNNRLWILQKQNCFLVVNLTELLV